MWKGHKNGLVRVLITGVGGNVGQGVLKALGESGLASWVVGLDANPLSVGLFLVDRGYTVPKATDPEFIDIFCNILQSENIDVALVCADAETLPIALLKPEIEARTKARLVLSDAETVACCADKWLTAQWAKRIGLPHPMTVLADDAAGIASLLQTTGYPIVVKPRHGYASRDVFTVHDSRQLALAVGTLGQDGVAQAHLDDKNGEYTAATFSCSPGAVEACIVMRRELLQGTSLQVEPVFDAALQAEVRRWGECAGGVGPMNFQFRITHSRPICFEVNPRFSGTIGIRFRFGYNDAAMAVRHFALGQPISQPALRPGVVLRYWEELFLPDVCVDDLKKGEPT